MCENSPQLSPQGAVQTEQAKMPTSQFLPVKETDYVLSQRLPEGPLLISLHHQGNANQSHCKISPHIYQDFYYQKAELTSVSEDAEKRNTYALSVAM